MNGITIGINYLKRGFSMIQEPVIRRFVVIPLILNLVIFVSFVTWSIGFASTQIDRMMAMIPEWLGFLEWLIWPIFVLLLVILIIYGFSIVANLIAAPFNGLLSEMVELKLTGKPLPTGSMWKELLESIPRSIKREVAKLPYYLIFLMLWICSLIPVIGFAATIVLFLFGAWMMATEYCDYPADNHKLTFGELKDRLKTRRATTFGFGTATMIGTMIPLLNLIVMPAAVCGATAYWVEDFGKDLIENRSEA